MLTKFRFDWRPFPYILCCSNETDTRGTGKTHVRILHRQQINMRQTVEMDAWVVLFSCRSIVLFVKRQEMMVPCWSTHYEFWTICCENLHRTTHHHYWFLSKCVPMVPIECCIYRWFLCPIVPFTVRVVTTILFLCAQRVEFVSRSQINFGISQ